MPALTTGLPVLIGWLVALPVLGLLVHLGSWSQTIDVWTHLWQTVMPGYAASTALIALGVVLGVSFVGMGGAWLVTRYEFRGRRWFEWALLLPLAMPAYVIAYAYTEFLQFSGPVQNSLRLLLGIEGRIAWFPEIRSTWGLVLMFVFVLYPYPYLLARSAFLDRSPSLLDAARTLGCSEWTMFWRVALPLARPALIAGAALALMESIADYGAVAYFGVPTFTFGLYNAWFSMGNRAAAAQLAVLLLLLVAFLLWVERRSRGQARYYAAPRAGREPVRVMLKPWQQALVWGLCMLPIMAGFLIPVAMLLSLLSDAEAFVHWSRYIVWARNSVIVAGVTAAIAALAAVVLAYAERLKGGRLLRFVNGLVSLGYAVPGAVLAVGILVPLARLDNGIDAFMREHFDVSTGLLFTGSIMALVYAYLVRYFAVGYQGIDAALRRITPSMDASARSLGAGQWETLRRVHLPLLLPSMWAAALLVFVDTIKELPATLVLRPFNFDTLAVVTYNFARDERLAEAALPALTIVMVSLIPVLLLSRAMSRPAK
jgi:iron(III) transport system permease protein